MTTGVNSIFIDTNILVYATNITSPFHTAALNALQNLANASVPLWVSRQILREYLAVMLRTNFATPIPIIALTGQVRAFEAQFQITEDNGTVTQNLLTLLETLTINSRLVHDANIVATMQSYNIHELLTHNVADFNRFAGLITIVPLIP